MGIKYARLVLRNFLWDSQVLSSKLSQILGNQLSNKQHILYQTEHLVTLSSVNAFCQQRITTLTVTVIPIA